MPERTSRSATDSSGSSVGTWKPRTTSTEISRVLATAGSHGLNGAVVSFGLDTLCQKSPGYFLRLAEGEGGLRAQQAGSDSRGLLCRLRRRSAGPRPKSGGGPSGHQCAVPGPGRESQADCRAVVAALQWRLRGLPRQSLRQASSSTISRERSVSWIPRFTMAARPRSGWRTSRPILTDMAA